MKCWHDNCSHKLTMDLVLVGYCPEHGDVWAAEKPVTPELKRMVAQLLTRQAPDHVVASLLAEMATKEG